jgi:hypothetical protein
MLVVGAAVEIDFGVGFEVISIAEGERVEAERMGSIRVSSFFNLRMRRSPGFSRRLGDSVPSLEI